MRTNGEGVQENLVNEKLAAAQAQQTAANEAQTKCCAPEQPNPKDIFLRRLDYAEDTLVRHLAAIRKFRQTLNWASPDTFHVLQELLNIEQVIQRF